MPVAVPTKPYILYSDSVEVKQPDEDKVAEEITKNMVEISGAMLDRFRHGLRSVHSKSHGILRGELEVFDGLAPSLKQGLFATPGKYGVIMRFSTNPGDLLGDDISTPRGLAIKIVGVEGEMLPAPAGAVTQDFVCVNGKTFPNKNSAEFLAQIKQLHMHVDDAEPIKKAVSATARGVNAVLGALGHASERLKGLGYPSTHPLGETYGTQVPLRYGDYIAKICFAPLSVNLKELTDKHVDIDGYAGMRDLIAEFFKTNTAVWEVQAQLCTDLETMPIEDASTEWPEDESPYQPVGKITVTPQDVYSPARRVYADDVLAFNP